MKKVIEKKERKILGLKYYEMIMIVIFLCLLIFILITNKDQNLKRHCENAVCNKDNTICYNYEEQEDGNTKKTWEGNCSKLKK